MTTSVAGIVPQWTMGDRLRKARELTGLDRTDFAAEIGVSRNTVTAYERDVPEHPRIVVLRSWALRCGVALDWLVHGDAPFTDPGQQSPNTHTDHTKTNSGLLHVAGILDPWLARAAEDATAA